MHVCVTGGTHSCVCQQVWRRWDGGNEWYMCVGVWVCESVGVGVYGYGDDGMRGMDGMCVCVCVCVGEGEVGWGE